MVLAAFVAMPCLAVDARATISLRAQCTGAEVTVTVSACNDYDVIYQGYVVVRQEIGTCADREVLMQAPQALPPSGDPYVSTDWERTTFVFPVPHLGMHYQYGALLVTTTGTLQYVPNRYLPQWECQPQPSDFAACAEAVVMRAQYLNIGMIGSRVLLLEVPCEAGCWGSTRSYEVDSSDPRVAAADMSVVDVYGAFGDARCWWGSVWPFYATRVAPAPAGSCGPLPSATIEFGTLKALYR